MVLRKPYAFLIKHFKLIHLIITVIIGYAVFLMNDTLNFISTFFKTNTGRAEALVHVHYSVIWLIILSLLIVGVIIWLMKYKDKPRMIYWMYIGAYIYVIIVAVVAFKELKAIFVATATLKGIKAVRDLLRIAIWAQYYFIACMLVRGLGFDVKRFNFRSDLEEFKIDKEDNEEVEVAFSGDGGALQRKGRRSLREFKYYYLENKYMINIILGVIAVVIIGSFILNKTVTNVVYNEGDSISSGKFTIGVASSYITNTTEDGRNILEGDDYLVVVRFSAMSNNKYKYKLNYNYLVLEAGNKDFIPTNKYNSYFSDIGVVYKNQYVNSNLKYFIVVYRVDNKYINKNMKFKYLGGLSDGKNIEFNISPLGMSNKKNVSKTKLKGKLNFNESILKDTYLKINKYEIKEKFEYNYKYLDQDYNAVIDSLSNNIIKLNIDSKIDDTIYIDKDWNTIMNTYMNVYYTVDGTTNESVLHYAKTPIGMKDSVYIQVDKEIENASDIWLEFNIRNQVYRYVLKES